MAIFGLFKKNKKETASKKENQTKTEAVTAKEELKVTEEKKADTLTAKEPIKKQAPASTKNDKTEATTKSTVKSNTSPKSTVAKKTDSAQKSTDAVQNPSPKKAEASATEKKIAAPKKETSTAPKKASANVATAASKESVKEQNDTPAEESKTYTGKFEINKSKDGKKFFFNLYASNKVGIATSQMYSSAQGALNGVNSVIANADKAPIEDQSLKKHETLPYPKWEIYVDNGGKYRFRLNASNGSCVCHSQGYTTKTACKNGIDSIIRSSRNAEIDKTYITKKDEK